MDKLRGVRRKLKSAMSVKEPSASSTSKSRKNSVSEQDQAYIPAVQEKHAGFFQKLRRNKQFHSVSGDDETRELRMDDNDDDDYSSSPEHEQETVAKRPAAAKTPHVQDLFPAQESAKASVAGSGAKPLMTAVLPDGSIMTARDETKSADENA